LNTRKYGGVFYFKIHLKSLNFSKLLLKFNVLLLYQLKPVNFVDERLNTIVRLVFPLSRIALQVSHLQS